MTGKNGSLGFSLFELLVVISIIAGLVTLLGGLTNNFLQKAQAQTELVGFSNMIKKTSVRAFASGTSLALSLDKNRAQLYKNRKIMAEKFFDHISFSEQEIIFNRNGYPDVSSVSIGIRDKSRELALRPLIMGSFNAIQSEDNDY